MFKYQNGKKHHRVPIRYVGVPIHAYRYGKDRSDTLFTLQIPVADFCTDTCDAYRYIHGRTDTPVSCIGTCE